MNSPSPEAQTVLLDHLDLLTRLDRSLPVLDLACGEGRNGLVLAQRAIEVVFADRSASALEVVKQRLVEHGLPGRVWQVDLEQPDTDPLSGQCFAAIICFRYLHRPLFPALLNAVMPGGLLIYETFTMENRRFRRPHNPDFLLQPGELKAWFKGWELIHYFEGVEHNPERAVARIVTRKPAKPA